MEEAARKLLRVIKYNIILLKELKINLLLTIIKEPKAMFQKSWKTTSAGILTLVSVAVGLIFAPVITPALIMASATSALAGIGLLFSKDSNVTGGTTAATPEAAHRVH